ncbi:MAG: tetraacyldisaccharide 4'-kinase [Hyphococcus sp.]|nr:MAG: tetraacyldisaccharide 4'-kinase [Marinicaulis sp.]
MRSEPWFWREQSAVARIIKTGLTPLSAAYDGAQRLRTQFTKPFIADVPVICVGNASLGGVGKTPFSIALHTLLKTKGVNTDFLTRGYGGSFRGPIKADLANHDASMIGDEAMLLARCAPTWVSADRPAGAVQAAKAGADAIIMDDGFQNPTLKKDCSILLIDEDSADPDNMVFPGGPMREPLSRAKARADIIVAIGASEKSATALAQKQSTPFAAWLEVENAQPPQNVVAFCGIGKPEKFFTTLTAHGFTLVERTAFPDHHRYTEQDLDALKRLARKTDAALITTEKDHVRLPEAFRQEVLTLPVKMKINAPDQLLQKVVSIINPLSEGASS